jgi:para-aminobenzoate synthetase component 1
MLQLSDILAKVGNLTVEKNEFSLPCSFIDFAEIFAEIPGTSVLVSGGDSDSARYDIIATDPFFFLKCRYNDATISIDNEVFQITCDPFNLLDGILTHFKTPMVDLPVSNGLFGYLSYDLKDVIEKLPRTSVDDLSLPHMFFTIPGLIIIHDRKKGVTTKVEIFRDGRDTNRLNILELFEKRVSGQKGYTAGLNGLKSNFEKDEYVRTIEKIRDYIKEGHVYQVNMSQRFRTDFKGSSFQLFKDLYLKNPAPFFSYMNCTDHTIVSTSPERFVSRSGNYVEARPIKGTRPRGKSEIEDLANRKDLVKSKKDDAELSMIVDLLRNDIGKVCVGDSVKVKEHKRVEAYENVYHLVSVIEGELSERMGSADLIKASFPGGSITGCPKIRSMEIIDELESVRRHIYTGSIGYVSFHDTMDFSIAIRTALIKNDTLFFSVGGGIVYDSDPLDEYEETLHKGKTFFDVISRSADVESSYVWIDGKIVKDEDAKVSPLTPGFQYGYGFFETILVKNGDIQFLDEHVARLNLASKQFFGRIPDITWKQTIELVLEKNNLINETCAVKVLISKGDSDSSPYNDFHMVSARRYTHRLSLLKKESLDLGIFETPRHSYLSDYKTMNYMYYFEAGRWAKQSGFDEAIVLNSDGSISETNTANIILIKEDTFITPQSDHYLSGTMEKIVIKHLLKMGFEQKKEKIFPENISEDYGVILTNSLMGVVSVSSVNRKKVLTLSKLCMDLNNMVKN